MFYNLFFVEQKIPGTFKRWKKYVNFKHEFGEYRITNTNTPEAAICYDEDFICRLYEEYQLKITKPIRYGSWCGRSDFLSYQDIIIASKE